MVRHLLVKPDGMAHALPVKLRDLQSRTGNHGELQILFYSEAQRSRSDFEATSLLDDRNDRGCIQVGRKAF